MTEIEIQAQLDKENIDIPQLFEELKHKDTSKENKENNPMITKRKPLGIQDPNIILDEAFKKLPKPQKICQTEVDQKPDVQITVINNNAENMVPPNIEPIEENPSKSNGKEEPNEESLNPFSSEDSNTSPIDFTQKIPRILSKYEFKRMICKKESDRTIISYGPEIFVSMKRQETLEKIPINFLERHKVHPSTRTKMVDWMLEVLNAYRATDETFFQSVRIMDKFIQKSKAIIYDNNIHLLGVSSMYVAMKVQEIYPPLISDFVHKICHDKFRDKHIFKTEQKIMTTVCFDELLCISPYDFIVTFFYDFSVNNLSMLVDNWDMKIHGYIKETSIFLSKMLSHYELYYENLCSDKAVACIMSACQIVEKYFGSKMTDKQKSRYNDWCSFLIKQNKGDFEKSLELCGKVTSTFDYHLNYSGCKNLYNFYRPSYL